MSEQLRGHSHRTRGSWTPRLAGIALVVLIAGGGLVLRLAAGGQPRNVTGTEPPHHHQSSGHAQAQAQTRVVHAESVGLIDFGPYDDHDNWRNDPDDHPLMLVPGRSGLAFVPVPQSRLTNGTPEWTVNVTADGSDIFIDITTGECLADIAGHQLALARCDLSARQRWLPIHNRVLGGQSIAQYSGVSDGECITDRSRKNGPDARALLAACGPARTKSQELALWWSG